MRIAATAGFNQIEVNSCLEVIELFIKIVSIRNGVILIASGCVLIAKDCLQLSISFTVGNRPTGSAEIFWSHAGLNFLILTWRPATPCSGYLAGYDHFP
jgi:hypothetical protein